ncbi:MFS transporter [Gordonia neofelifaecis]|uniref:Major facilitator transporter n=1 Tax=Gordonia neofelifaecis NRRL B-59395 TaxID=644548 RepID=F1YNH7_9ACTN|nr:MFS transporter [Gordonia neofelifaecis]EGD53714.1 major facilitator transporter [Gordonia neofelifaecis NRRL B-59395]
MAESPVNVEASDDAAARRRPASRRNRTFAAILGNTAVANLTTSYLFFALTFWIYLETRNVIATGVVGGGYMLAIALCSIAFGTFVDRFRKLTVMRASAAFTTVAFAAAGAVYFVAGDSMRSLTSPWVWLFSVIVLAGAVVEVLRDVALSTTVTILIDSDRRANANGYVGAVQGLSFVFTSVFSGLSVGFFGMGPTIVFAVALTLIGWLHLLTIRMPEEAVVAASDAAGAFDVRGAWLATRAVPGLLALIVFSMFNNFVSGVHMALLDPYGLELFSVQSWGLVFAFGATGFMLGGALIGKFGLGSNPMRTMLLGVVVLGAISMLFAIREWSWLLVAGVWLFMLTMPAIEAAEQTVIQRVVPLPQQGRVFGFAGALEASAAPLTSFVVAPLAEQFVIPYARSADGADHLAPWLGEGDARGIALIFVASGAVMIAVAVAAFGTPVYRRMSEAYRAAK